MLDARSWRARGAVVIAVQMPVLSGSARQAVVVRPPQDLPA
jgi:hypothetical protein